MSLVALLDLLSLEYCALWRISLDILDIFFFWQDCGAYLEITSSGLPVEYTDCTSAER